MATSTKKRSATPRKITASKTSASKAASTKPADTLADNPVAVGASTDMATAPEPTLVSQIDATVSEPELRKKDLIDLVVARSGIKKKDAKPVVEAMLAVLGETIAHGRELNLQPLGKLRINRAVEKGNGRVIICKLRQSLSSASGPDAGLGAGSSDPGKDTLAVAAEDL